MCMDVDDCLRRYHANGYVTRIPFLDRDALLQARIACDRRLQQPGCDPHWLMDVHTGSDGAWLMDVLQRGDTLRLLRAFCGERVCLSSSQFFVKPPICNGGGRPVGWHQDGFDSVQGDFEEPPEVEHENVGPLSLWVPLDDVDEVSGALRVLPRMHRTGRLPVGQMTADEAASGVGIGIDASVIAAHEAHAITYDLRAGEAAAHHPCTPHSSSINRSASPRRVLVLRFIPAEPYAARHQGLFGPLISLSRWQHEGRPSGRCLLLSNPRSLSPRAGSHASREKDMDE